MKRFNSKGMLIIPKPKKLTQNEEDLMLIIKECYCPNGHNLISNRVRFAGFPGILLKAKKEDGSEGLIALSPIWNEKSRISLDLDLHKGEKLELFCPKCGEALPIYNKCPICHGDLVSMFLEPNNDFSNCLSVCNVIDCPEAEIKKGGDRLLYSDME